MNDKREFTNKLYNSDEKQNCNSKFSKPLDLTSNSTKETEINRDCKNIYEQETKCNYCNLTFQDFQAQVDHLCKPFKCLHCCELFLYDYQLNMHETECTDENVDKKNTGHRDIQFQCKSCETVFQTSGTLSIHKDSCIKKQIKQSHKCSKKLSNPKGDQKFVKNKKNSQRYKNASHPLHNSVTKSSKECAKFLSSCDDSKQLPVKEKKYSLRRNNSSSEINSESSDVAFCNDDNSEHPNEEVNLHNKKKVVVKNINKYSSAKIRKYVTANNSKETVSKELHDESMNFETKSNCNITSSFSENFDFFKKCGTDPEFKCNEFMGEGVPNAKFTELLQDALSKLENGNKLDSSETVLSTTLSLDSPLSNYGEVVHMKRKGINDNDSEKSLRMKKVKRPEKYKNKILTNSLEIKEKQCNEQNTDMEISNLESMSQSNNNKNIGKTSISSKMRKGKGGDQIYSKTSENLICSTQVSSSSYAPEKNIEESSILKNFERELEISESTLNSISEDVYDSNILYYSNAREIEKPSTSTGFGSGKRTINLECLLKGLPDESSGFLIKVSGNTSDSFRCPKCNKLFRQIKGAFNHYYSCKCSKLLRSKMKVPLSEIELFCTTCHYHCSEIPELFTHKRSCTPNVLNNISDCIRYYENTSKNHVCKECGYSCLSYHTFSQHACEKRLERMTTCVVGIKKLTSEQLKANDELCKLKCSSCSAIFFDDVTFEKHAETHMNDNIQFAKISIVKGKARVRNEIKKFAKNSQIFDSVHSIIENLVKPVAKMSSIMDPENIFPDLKMDFTIPYENQKLLFDAIKDSTLSQEMDGFNDIAKSLENQMTEENNENSDSDEQSDYAASQINNVKCHCKSKSTDPNADIKPCQACLDAFMEAYMNNDTTASDHEKEESIDNVASGMNIPPTSASDTPNSFTCPSTSFSNSVNCTPKIPSVDDSREINLISGPVFVSNPNQNKADTLDGGACAKEILSGNVSEDCLANSNLGTGLLNVECTNDSETEQKQFTFEELLEISLISNNEYDVHFAVDSATVTIHFHFDVRVAYSVYAKRSTGVFFCAFCLQAIPPSNLIQHLVHVHEETIIIIYVS